MPDAQNNREGSQARKPFKCLNGRAMEKDWPKKPSDRHIRAIVYESEEKHLRLRVKQLISGSLNGMGIRQSLPQPYIPRTGTQVPWKVQQLGAGV